MLRDVKHVRCPNCGHRFLAWDVEDNASVKSMVVRCPNCGEIVKIDWSGLLDYLRRGLEMLEKMTTKKEGWI